MGKYVYLYEIKKKVGLLSYKQKKDSDYPSFYLFRKINSLKYSEVVALQIDRACFFAFFFFFFLAFFFGGGGCIRHFYQMAVVYLKGQGQQPTNRAPVYNQVEGHRASYLDGRTAPRTAAMDTFR